MFTFSFVPVTRIDQVTYNAHLFKNLSTQSSQENFHSLYTRVNAKKKMAYWRKRNFFIRDNSNSVYLKNALENNQEELQTYENLTDDKGVIKKIITKGSGLTPGTNAIVKVHYTGKLEDGQVFDSSLDRKDPYIFEMDQGKVIKGWEIAIKTMKIGEKCELIIDSKYGYKKKGIPPIIPPNAKLYFEIELLETKNSFDQEIMFSNNSASTAPRTPQKIAQEFEKKISLKNEAEKKNKMENFFFISPFQSQSGEKAPWWLNPNITFVFVFISVFLLFYIVLQVGGIHQGYIDQY